VGEYALTPVLATEHCLWWCEPVHRHNYVIVSDFVEIQKRLTSPTVSSTLAKYLLSW